MLEQATQGGWDILTDTQNAAGHRLEQPNSICPCFLEGKGPGEQKLLPVHVNL